MPPQAKMRPAPIIIRRLPAYFLRVSVPAVPIPEIKASSANPPLEGGFGGQVAPVWVEDELGVAPSTGDQTEKIWLYLYETIRNGAPYPITIDQAVEVVRVIDKVKQGPIDVVK